MILVVLDPKVGEIDRYVTVPHKERFVRTHGAKAERPVTFTKEIVKTFREGKNIEQYRIREEPPDQPVPPGTTSPVREVQLQMAA